MMNEATRSEKWIELKNELNENDVCLFDEAWITGQMTMSIQDEEVCVQKVSSTLGVIPCPNNKLHSFCSINNMRDGEGVPSNLC